MAGGHLETERPVLLALPVMPMTGRSIPAFSAMPVSGFLNSLGPAGSAS